MFQPNFNKHSAFWRNDVALGPEKARDRAHKLTVPYL
jgi:hypothetical protein